MYETNVDVVEIDRESNVCYYYPKVTCWVIVSAALIIISLISYFSFHVIWCKVNPFNKSVNNDNYDEEERQKANIQSIIKFYQYMFVTAFVLLFLSGFFSTILSEICSVSISTVFKEEYVAAILILISYIMVSLTLNLLWFSKQNTNLCKIVGIIFIIAEFTHCGFILISFHWMKIAEPIESIQLYNKQRLNNYSIILMVIAAIISHTVLWVFIYKVFNYKFCSCFKTSSSPSTHLTVNLV